VYADAVRGYALYAGVDGQGLWCVPAGGAPVRWVVDGAAFVSYAP
jgi:hypothetical protein